MFVFIFSSLSLNFGGRLHLPQEQTLDRVGRSSLTVEESYYTSIINLGKRRALSQPHFLPISGEEQCKVRECQIESIHDVLWKLAQIPGVLESSTLCPPGTRPVCPDFLTTASLEWTRGLSQAWITSHGINHQFLFSNELHGIRLDLNDGNNQKSITPHDYCRALFASTNLTPPD